MRRMSSITGGMLSLGLLIAPAALLRGADQPAGAAPAQAEVFQRFIAIDNVCAWPNLTVLRDGTITAAIFNQPCHGRWEGDVECWSSRDGRFWEKRGTPAPHAPGENRMNVAAGLARDGSLVVLASGWSRRPKAGEGLGRDPTLKEADLLPVWVCRSGDQGRTWQREEADVAPPGEKDSRLVPFGDIVALGDGALGVCLYSVRASAQVSTSHFYVSRDDGRTWSCRSQLQAGINETTPVVLPDGRVLAAGRTLGDQHLELFESADHGATWVGKGSLTGRMQHPADLLLLADGRLLLSYSSRVKGRFGVEAKFSADGGNTWSAPVVLVSDSLTGDCGYPSSVQLPGGEILTAYYSAAVASHRRYHMGVALWNLPSKAAR